MPPLRNQKLLQTLRMKTLCLSGELKGLLRDMSANPLYKTALCEYYSAGYCRNGLDCQFAHGHEELRQSSVEPESSRTKTMLCRYWEAGHCRNGSSCPFAHGQNELRFGGEGGVLPALRQPRRQTRGTGWQGAPPPPPPPPRGRPAAGMKGYSSGSDATRDKLYKTALCRHWETAGVCEFGDACHFAHGSQELRPHPTSLRGGSSNSLQAAWGPEDPWSAAEQPPPGAWGDGGMQQAGSSLSRNPRYKTELCRYWEAGECRNASCPFAHGTTELRPYLGSDGGGQPDWDQGSRRAPRGGGSTGGRTAGGGYDHSGSDPSLYKTVLCRYWQAGEECAKGTECGFAHGPAELRSRQTSSVPRARGPPQQPPTKRVPCRHWQATGSCRLGDLCGFAHPALEGWQPRRARPQRSHTTPVPPPPPRPASPGSAGAAASEQGLAGSGVGSPEAGGMEAVGVEGAQAGLQAALAQMSLGANGFSSEEQPAAAAVSPEAAAAAGGGTAGMEGQGGRAEESSEFPNVLGMLLA